MSIFEPVTSSLMLTSSVFGFGCSTVFIIIVLCHSQCYTTTILLVLNSVLAGFISNVVCGSQAIYQLTSDGNDALCVLRGYLLYSVTGLLYHTLFVQALQRFFIIVLAARRYLQSKKVIISIVIIQWVVSSCFVLPVVLGGRINYNPGSRICLISINDPYGFLYIGTWVYFFTLSAIILMYVLIMRHMKMHLFTNNAPRRRIERRRQKREIRLYCRILLLLGILFIMGVPYCIFFFLSIINGLSPAPPYADRICFLSISIGYSMSMLLSLLCTDDVRYILVRWICGNRPVQRRRQINCTTNLPMRSVIRNVTTQAQLNVVTR